MVKGKFFLDSDMGSATKIAVYCVTFKAILVVFFSKATRYLKPDLINSER